MVPLSNAHQRQHPDLLSRSPATLNLVQCHLTAKLTQMIPVATPRTTRPSTTWRDCLSWVPKRGKEEAGHELSPSNRR